MPELHQRELPHEATTHPLIAAARDLADDLLGRLDGRWRHTQGVARTAAAAAAAVPAADRPVLVAAAWLHDIGYAEPLRRSGFHPLDGAWHLQKDRWPEPFAGLGVLTRDVVDTRRGGLIMKETSGRSGGA